MEKKVIRIGSLKSEAPQQIKSAEIIPDRNGQAEIKEKVFTPIAEILSFFEKDKQYTKDQALRLIGLVSNYSTRQVYEIYERFVFEGSVKIQKTNTTGNKTPPLIV